MENYLTPILITSASLVILFLLAYGNELRKDPIDLLKRLIGVPVGLFLLLMDIIAGRGEEKNTFE